MAVTIPASDVVSTNLNSVITNLSAAITAAAGNGPLIARLTGQKANAQMNLVLHLLGSGKILASNVLTNETYAAAQDGADQRG